MKKSILSERIVHRGGARAAGKIRCGAKVLTSEAQKNKNAVAVFDAGRKSGKKASEIEAELKKLGLDRPLRPINTREFHVFARDFDLEIFPQLILQQYGEGKGEDRKLYKFPVTFHSNHLHDFFPHAFECHSLPDKFRSAFDDSGNRVCETMREVQGGEVKAQRQAGIKRVPRRDWEVRGLCDPRACKEFQGGHCKFRGRLKFYLPEISGLGLVEIETSSEYAAENIWETLDQISSQLGYIPRTNPRKPGEPVFWMEKVQEERVYYDDKGRHVGLQWVPKLFANIDMGTLVAMREASGEGPTAPTAWLATAPATTASIAPIDEAKQVVPEDVTTVVSHKVVSDSSLVAQLEADLEKAGADKALFIRYVEMRYGRQWRQNQSAVEEAVQALEKLAKYGKQKIDLIVRSRLLAHDYEVDQDRLAAYATEKFGAWQRDFAKMGQVVAHIESLFAQGRQFALQAIEQVSDLVTQAQ